MRVLVTRPTNDALDTAAKLSARGHEPLVAPLLEIRFRKGPRISLAGVQAVLATSSNGVHALTARVKTRDAAVFAVGPQTAEAARAEGFSVVKNAGGDGHALVEAAARWAVPHGGTLLHAAGAETQGYVAADLQARGFEVASVTLYDAVAVEKLPEVARDALQEGTLDAALYYSPRSARVFADCVRKAELGDRCGRVVACCISRGTADALAPLAFQAVRVASHPDGEAIIALLTPADRRI